MEFAACGAAWVAAGGAACGAAGGSACSAAAGAACGAGSEELALAPGDLVVACTVHLAGVLVEVMPDVGDMPEKDS